MLLPPPPPPPPRSLRCAIENGRVAIIKTLLAQNAAIVAQLDFLALYRTEHRVFLDSPRLWQGLISDEAMRSDGRQTPVLTYRQCLLPFLGPLVPGMRERLADKGVKSAKFPNGDGFLQTLSFSDLLLWAVFVGDLQLAECFWHSLLQTGSWAPKGDPVRMALIAAQASLAVSKISQTESNKYRANAEVFEQWACNVLDKCSSREDAMLVLMRPSQHWPDTILRVAIDGENKNFVGHRFVQMIVDECWRGNSFGSLYALPQDATFADVFIHVVFPRINMEPLVEARSRPISERRGGATPLAPTATLPVTSLPVTSFFL